MPSSHFSSVTDSHCIAAFAHYLAGDLCKRSGRASDGVAVTSILLSYIHADADRQTDMPAYIHTHIQTTDRRTDKQTNASVHIVTLNPAC